jgi:hypothetical protein
VRTFAKDSLDASVDADAVAILDNSIGQHCSQVAGNECSGPDRTKVRSQQPGDEPVRNQSF